MKKIKALAGLFVIFALAGCVSPKPKVNVLEQIQQEERERRIGYLNTHPNTDPAIAEAIRTGNIEVGMNRNEAVASFGKPRRINRTGGITGNREQWVYYSKYLYFDEGTLVSWQTSEPIRIDYDAPNPIGPREFR